jgi:hypothetical protein
MYGDLWLLRENLRIPIYSAYQHIALQFAGASQQALGAHLDKLRKMYH